MVTVIPVEKHLRKPGRPRAIPEKYEPLVVELYDQGYGYRAIARILREKYGLDASGILKGARELCG